MSVNLSNIAPAKGATKKRKEVGRGGKRGTYSGRGMKGQRSRSGVSGLKALGLRQMLLSTPKSRGFKSIHPKLPAINISLLEKYFDNGEIVDYKKLAQKKLIEKGNKQYKILGSGKLTKKLTVFADGFSASAKSAIESVGGKAELK